MDTQAPSGLGISMGNRFFLAYVWLFYKKVVRKKEQTFILILLVLRQAVFLVGRKGIEPIKTFVIEFTAQPVLPINGTFLHKRKKQNSNFFFIFFFFFFFFFFSSSFRTRGRCFCFRGIVNFNLSHTSSHNNYSLVYIKVGLLNQSYC